MPSLITTDRIEEQIRLSSSRARVWKALTDSREFGAWFGVRLEGQFVAGATTRGHMTERGYEHVPFEAIVESMEPERLFSFRWHPYAIEPGVDYSGEPPTVVTFTLNDVEGGTSLAVVESGFEKLPASRRDKAIEMHTTGWTAQMTNIRKYLAMHA
jgi:uncharacterized protein YndB with AHSA1/START domain